MAISDRQRNGEVGWNVEGGRCRRETGLDQTTYVRALRRLDDTFLCSLKFLVFSFGRALVIELSRL